MAAPRDHIRFLLNDTPVETSDVAPDATLLDYLRLGCRLTGTKEGCAEGDCGACTVLVGRPSATGLIYETVNACIRFLASVDGCHVVTIEHLSRNGSLHPVQQAMVDMHGSQCGFCTPGIVMSLYALWMHTPNPSQSEVEEALQGNLCRCTGYAPIIRAAQSVKGDPGADPLISERGAVQTALASMQDGRSVEIDSSDGRVFLPATVDDLAAQLTATPEATIVAGATDVGLWVTKFMRPISPVIYIAHLMELQEITSDQNGITIGAGVTYTAFFETLEAHFPQLRPFWARIGGWQVRNMGTIGGNIANGSPIGDTPPMLIALGATITLRRGTERRELPLENFFIDYGKQDLEPGEFLESIHVPLPRKGDIFEVHKISKRKDEDISSVCGAFWIRCTNGMVEDARIAFGGMAATPKRARAVEKSLIGQPWTAVTVFQAQDSFAKDFTPISDMRASAEYRAVVARNLLMRVFRESVPEDAVT